MGGSSQEKAATEQARTSASLQSQLSGVLQPNLNAALAAVFKDVGNGYGLPNSIEQAFGKARGQLNESYDQQAMINPQAINYRAKQSGQAISQGQIQSTIGQAGYALEQDRQAALRNLKFQESQAGMQQYNTLLNQIGLGGQTSMGLATGNMQMAGNYIAGMNNQSPWGGALGGAASGAAAGSTLGPWGAVAGGLAGGALGYFQGRA